VASIHQTGMAAPLVHNTKKEPPTVKATVITDRVFQTELVIKMTEPREESKEGQGIVRKEVRIVQLANGLITMFKTNLRDKLEQILWLINNLKK